MKRLITTLILAFSIVLWGSSVASWAAATPYNTQVLTNFSTGLVGYWRHTETSGTSVADSSTSNKPCTLSGTVTLNQTSLLTDDSNPSALYAGGYCTTASYVSTTTGVTLSVVAKFTSFPTDSDTGHTALVTIGTIGVSGLHNLRVDKNGEIRYSFTGGNMVSGVFLAVNKTYHLAVTHDFVTKTVKFFVNGLVRSELTHSGGVTGASSKPVRIGETSHLGVVLDDVAGWADIPSTRVLSEDEMKMLFRSSRAVDVSQVVHYAATTGSETAKGTLAAPLTLVAAVQSGFARGNERVEIRGGTYPGLIAPGLRGDSASARVTLVNYEGEHVKITQPSNNSALAPLSTAKHLIIQGRRKLGLQTLEIVNEGTDRESTVVGSAPPDVDGRGNYDGIQLSGQDVNLRNLVTHDTATGISSFQNHAYGEMYGTISFNPGWHGPDRAHGHGFYTQNNSGQLKSFRNYININSFDTNGKAYGQSLTSFTDNYLFEDGITVGSGWPEAVLQLENSTINPTGVNLTGTSVTAGSTNLTASSAVFSSGNQGMWIRIPGADMLGRNFYGHIKTFVSTTSVTLDEPARTTVSNVTTRGVLLTSDSDNVFFAGLLVGGQDTPATNITIRRMVSNDLFWIGYTMPYNNDVSLTDSYIGRVKYSNWRNLVHTGNTQFSVKHGSSAGDNRPRVILLETENGNPPSGVYNVNSNAYWTTGGSGDQFDYNAVAKSFGQWQAIPFDAASTHTTTLPTVNAVFVKPNEYEQGACHIAIFNWQGLSNVSTNISTCGLSSGQLYEVRNVQALFSDIVVASTAYNSGAPTISIPMTSTAFTKPIGYTYGLENTLPLYGVFVLLPGTQAGPPVPTAPTNLTAAWAYSSRGATGNITLTWTDTSSVETGFVIEKSSDGIIWSSVTTTAANIVSYTVLGTILDATSLWRFRIRSTNATGDSSNVGPVTEWATKVSCFVEPCTR